MISFLHSSAVNGINAYLIDVEVDISSGLRLLPTFKRKLSVLYNGFNFKVKILSLE